ncbi:MAG: uroporphyrinogen-III C-methyltransferase [Acidobacteria bacterium]|nr:uroporphyrinogen-III C-methyltransferase [Acidobacteriota bacterium]
MTSPSAPPTRGRVVLIGAGPGDPGLLTTRGLRVLADADVVVYDRDAARLLSLARHDAERLEVGAPAEGAMAQDAIAMLIADKARDGLLVARLKLGDPFLFGSGAKEALFLHEQRVPFEVVPGVPLAMGSAYAGVPITYPGGQDALTLLRAHESAGEAPPDVDWKALAALGGTIAAYTNGRQAAAILTNLIKHGRAATHTAALIIDGTLPQQQTLTGTLAELAVAAENRDESALLVVGDVAGLRGHLRWFDQRPLFGKRIVVTRSREQARGLVDQLEGLGVQTLEAPTFRLMAAEDPESVDRAVASADQYEWLVFESANAASRFFTALLTGTRDLRVLGGVRIAAIGPSTADRLQSFGLHPDVVVPESGTDATVRALEAHGSIRGTRMLVVRPDHGRVEHARESLAADLRRHGADATDLIAYRTAPGAPESAAAQKLYRQLLDGQVDAVTFTTPTAVQRFAELIGRDQAADLLNQTVVVAIGPVTAAAAQALGITAPLVADPFTVDGLVATLVKTLR